MNYPKTKIDYVNLILTENKENPDFIWQNRTPDKLLFEWFLTGRVGESLRLTESGMLAFNSTNIEHYDIDFEVPKPTTNGVGPFWYFQLFNKKIKCPYYIGTKTIDKKKQIYLRLYDSKIAMMIALYGDVFSYLETVK